MKGEIFHILNRGVEKRIIFIKDEDYLRCVYNLRDFNNKNNVVLSYSRRYSKNNVVGGRTSDNVPIIPVKPAKLIVDTLCWCLMPNHLHILAQEKIDKGTGMFAKKITGGYTMYFNLKNNRSGVLFQGRSKIIRVTRDPHFFYLPYYILSNPVELIEPHWKERGIKNLNRVIEFLENYRYSSFLDLIGKDNFPSVINKNLFYELFDTNEKKFKRDFIEWLKDYKTGEFEKFTE